MTSFAGGLLATMMETIGAPPRTSTTLRLIALDLVNHLRSGTATDRDAADFVAWRRANHEHEHALRDALRLQGFVRILASGAVRSTIVPIGSRISSQARSFPPPPIRVGRDAVV